MIVIWYTDPSMGTFGQTPASSRKFSSFYQYETVSRRLVRIRLELDRPVYEGEDDGSTAATYEVNMSVGFSPEELPIDLASWRADGSGKLYVTLDGNEQVLETRPTKDANVYDSSNISEYIHCGSPVTTEPHFPAGISAKHLSVLANDVMTSMQAIPEITARNVTALQLTDALKTRVAELFERPLDEFDQITDAQLLAKLKQQVAQIGDRALQPTDDIIKTSVDEVNALVESFEHLGVAPNAALETAFGNLRTAAGNLTNAVNDRAGVQENLVTLETARAAFGNAVTRLTSVQRMSLQGGLRASTNAINEARQSAETWEAIRASYEEVENVENIEGYEDITNETQVEV